MQVRVLKPIRLKDKVEQPGATVELEDSVAKVLIEKKAVEVVKATTTTKSKQEK